MLSDWVCFYKKRSIGFVEYCVIGHHLSTSCSFRFNIWCPTILCVISAMILDLMILDILSLLLSQSRRKTCVVMLVLSMVQLDLTRWSRQWLCQVAFLLAW